MSNQVNLMEYLKHMQAYKASDFIINVGFPPCYKIDGDLVKIGEEALSIEEVSDLVYDTLNDKLRFEFKKTHEANFSLSTEYGRFRVSAFMQQNYPGMVIRRTETCIPSLQELGLPGQLQTIIMERRGIILITGATGSGKTTSLASMIDYRNQTAKDHIICIEDPIEFIHQSKLSMITQREVYSDTETWEVALKNTLRQAPNVIVIGEIRDQQAMEYAMQYAETGHLVVATLHANNANQAIERVVSFFPAQQKQRILMDLSLNLKAIISQRLVRKIESGRIPAVEIMIGTARIADLLIKNEIHLLKDTIKNSKELGMVCFDDALFDLYEANLISYEEALTQADSENDLRLKIKLKQGVSEETPPHWRVQDRTIDELEYNSAYKKFLKQPFKN